MKNEPIKGYKYWDTHPDHTPEEWAYEVHSNYTRRGYWEWVRAIVEGETDDK